MQALLTQDIVYNYIRNYCYNPVCDVDTELIDTDTDLSELPIQFNYNIYYVPDAYCVHGSKLYLVLTPGSGPWSGNSISNLYVGEQIRTGETVVANIDSYDYDHSRFKEITVDSELTLYEVINARSGIIKMAFSNVGSARDYIRNYIEPGMYTIQVSKLSTNDGYMGEWDDHQLVFYGKVQ